MLETAHKMSLSQGIQRFTDELENGCFDKLETSKIIFLNQTKASDKKSLFLLCTRDFDGEINLALIVVDPDYVWCHAWLTKKKTKNSTLST